MKRKSLIATLILIFGGALIISTVPTAADFTVPTFQIGVGETKFWDGQYVGTGQACTNCEFKLETGDGGARLRVGLDLVLENRADGSIHPDAGAGRSFKLQILDEQDVEVKSANSNYSVELLLCFNRDLDGDGTVKIHEMCETWRQSEELCQDELFPEFCTQESAYAKSLKEGSGKEGSGRRWTIKVIPGDNSGWGFRMRAKLEGATGPPAIQDELLPNLRAIPPFELTFKEPLVSAGFVVGHTPVDGDGFTDQEKADYVADVTAEVTREQGAAAGAAAGAVAAAAKAIRFSAGPENLGPGAFEVRGSPEHVDSEGHYIACQRTYNPDGTFARDREAGALEYHPEHGHFHYEFFRYELYQLTRTHPTKPWKKFKLGERTAGKKVGFCPADERMADWGRFFHDRRDRWGEERAKEFPNQGNCLTANLPMMGLSVGWGDLYEWARVEQFVVFPTNLNGTLREGYYLLQTTVDREERVAESNEDDNTSYVFFKVSGAAPPERQIEIVRRGYGLEP